MTRAGAARPAPRPRHRPGFMFRLGTALPAGFAVAHPLASPAFAVASASHVLPHRASPAQSPLRLPFGSVSGTVSPNVRYPGLGLLYALRRLGSHTPRSRLPKTTPPTFHYAPATFDLPSSTPEYDTNRHEYVGPSVYGFHIRYIPLIFKEKLVFVFHREHVSMVDRIS